MANISPLRILLSNIVLEPPLGLQHSWQEAGATEAIIADGIPLVKADFRTPVSC
jgi:hypothetical protein